MKLIHFQGLNCYHDCMITLANAFGLDYTAAFSGLWSEGRLRYDPICGVFLSRRIQETLEIMGMRLDLPLTEKKDREIGWSDIPAGNLVIIGMDACLIPWCPLYQLLHGPHYFIVQKGASMQQDCFDPTYGIIGQTMAAKELVSNAYALIAVKMDPSALPVTAPHTGPAPNPLLAQSQEVLKTHPETLRYFLERARIWVNGSEKNALFPAKYVDCLLAGRYLFRHFLEERDCSSENAPLFFSRHYYDEWMTVKNGFYKAALIRTNSAAFDEACHLLTCLFEQETELAEQVCSGESKHESRPIP
ncbi:hypothetical protein GPL15_15735 [Clostridium sp. MCC353]|uniref:hypothetical protein n=1 Tax=Clostridium sp. MCC353 TaxID=2592646 RepID=UPI001C021773|nr:hypothetical protein [Clostridium sp. MCC353]MBT9777953.1 hypothetical protein [Clostridium sp. MCC353]